MKPTVYIETTIPSLLTAWPSRDLLIAAAQAATREWWETRDRYELCVSEEVLREAGRGDAAAAAQRLAAIGDCIILPVTGDVERLTERILDAGLIPSRAIRDAIHIAVTAVHRVDICSPGTAVTSTTPPFNGGWSKCAGPPGMNYP